MTNPEKASCASVSHEYPVKTDQIIFIGLSAVHSGYCFVVKVATSSKAQLIVPPLIVNLIPPAPEPDENSVPLVAVPIFPEVEPTTEKVAAPSAPPSVQVNVQFSFFVLKGLVATEEMIPFPTFDPPMTGISTEGNT